MSYELAGVASSLNSSSEDGAELVTANAIRHAPASAVKRRTCPGMCSRALQGDRNQA